MNSFWFQGSPLLHQDIETKIPDVTPELPEVIENVQAIKSIKMQQVSIP